MGTTNQCVMIKGPRLRMIANLSNPRRGSTAVLHNGEMWVIGGEYYDGIKLSARCDIYNPAANAWRSCPHELTQARAHAVVAEMGGAVVVAGCGCGSRFQASLSKSAETYNPTTG